MEEYIKTRGNKKVKIVADKYGIELHTIRNGRQWTGMCVDIELLEMMRDTISEYLEGIKNG